MILLAFLGFALLLLAYQQPVHLFAYGWHARRWPRLGRRPLVTSSGASSPKGSILRKKKDELGGIYSLDRGS